MDAKRWQDNDGTTHETSQDEQKMRSLFVASGENWFPESRNDTVKDTGAKTVCDKNKHMHMVTKERTMLRFGYIFAPKRFVRRACCNNYYIHFRT